MSEHIFLLNLIGYISYIFFFKWNKPFHLLANISIIIVKWIEKSGGFEQLASN